MSAYTCKVIMFEGKSHPKKSIRPEPSRSKRDLKDSSVKKCLFGVADPDVTEMMLRKQIQEEKVRFEERFGFTMEDVEELEKENRDVVKLIVMSEPRVAQKKRKMLGISNLKIKQLCLTDYFKAKKNCQADRNKDNLEIVPEEQTINW